MGEMVTPARFERTTCPLGGVKVLAKTAGGVVLFGSIGTKMGQTSWKVATPARFERATYALGGRRSIQLSYGAVLPAGLPAKDTGAMTKPKPRSRVPGVYYRDDGAPRWEVKVRWTKKPRRPGSVAGNEEKDAGQEDAGQEAEKREEAKSTEEAKKEEAKQRRGWLPTVRYPVNPKAKHGDVDHINRAKADAEAYAIRERQSLATFGRPHALRAEAWTLRALLERYLEDLDKGRIQHKAVRTERSTIRMLLGQGKGHNAAGFPDLVNVWVRDLEYADFVGDGADSLQSLLKDRDGNPAGTGSLKRVLGVVRGVFTRAESTWGIEIRNPLQTIKGLSVSDARERVVSADEWTKITKELEQHEQGTQDAIVFARFTAARRAEVVKLDWPDIDFKNKTARLRETKSRANKVVDRVIPLPAAALAIVERRAQPADAKRPLTAEKLAALGLSGPVFTSGKGKRLRPDTMTQAWTRACGRAGVEGARIHDLRHTRITELGRFLTAAEAARVSGHTDLATFFRYFNPDPVETGKKIDAMERGQHGNADAIRKAATSLAALSPEDFAAAIIAAIATRSQNAAGK